MPASATTMLLTGASSGLGLAAARLLGSDPSRTLILPVRSAERAAETRAALAGVSASIETPLADLASLTKVRALVASLAGRPIDGLACIAGLQFQHGQARTVDGFETTFAVNQLGHVALLAGLLPQVTAGAPVVFIGSGTHDTKEFWSKLFGFKGGRYTSAERLAAGDCGPVKNPVQHGRDLYGTSKLCNVATAHALARQIPATQARFFSVDPGLMPGTGLARDGNAAIRFVWTRVMRPLMPGLPGVSTAERSGLVVANLLSGALAAGLSGVDFDYQGRVAETSAASHDPALADDLLRGCLKLCGLPVSALPAGA